MCGHDILSFPSEKLQDGATGRAPGPAQPLHTWSRSQRTPPGWLQPWQLAHGAVPRSPPSVVNYSSISLLTSLGFFVSPPVTNEFPGALSSAVEQNQRSRRVAVIRLDSCTAAASFLPTTSPWCRRGVRRKNLPCPEPPALLILTCNCITSAPQNTDPRHCMALSTTGLGSTSLAKSHRAGSVQSGSQQHVGLKQKTT